MQGQLSNVFPLPGLRTATSFPRQQLSKLLAKHGLPSISVPSECLQCVIALDRPLPESYGNMMQFVPYQPSVWCTQLLAHTHTLVMSSRPHMHVDMIMPKAVMPCGWLHRQADLDPLLCSGIQCTLPDIEFMHIYINQHTQNIVKHTAVQDR